MSLDESYSVADVADAFGMSEHQIATLIRAGKVGWYRGKRGQKRMLPEHIAELRAAIDMRVPEDPHLADLAAIGATSRSRAHRRTA